MKITITGSLGHISQSLTKELVEKGHAVTVISSKPEKQKDIEALGAAIGKPDLKWIVITDEQLKSGLEAFGMPAPIAAGFVEMNASMHRGELFRDYYLNKPRVMGKVKMTDFAKEFAAAFTQS